MLAHQQEATLKCSTLLVSASAQAVCRERTDFSFFSLSLTEKRTAVEYYAQVMHLDSPHGMWWISAWSQAVLEGEFCMCVGGSTQLDWKLEIKLFHKVSVVCFFQLGCLH